MKITLYIVDKKSKERLYTPLIDHYSKLISRFATIDVVTLFDKHIAKAQEISADKAKASYTHAFSEYLGKGYDVALDPEGKTIDSFDFANLLKDRQRIHFYIGGAYGLEREFVRQCNTSVSFGKITLSHKLAKVVLLEQIYRGLSINANHPYHK